MQQKNVGGKILQDGGGGYFSKQPAQQSFQHPTPLSPPQCCTNTENTEIFRKILTNIESLDNSQSKSNIQPLFLPSVLELMTYVVAFWDWKLFCASSSLYRLNDSRQAQRYLQHGLTIVLRHILWPIMTKMFYQSISKEMDRSSTHCFP